MKYRSKGFTLLELMIVIAIIGILAIIAIPNYISYRDKAYCSAAENDARAIIAALADYFSIPSHNSLIVQVDITANMTNNQQSTINEVSYKRLSGNNTARIYGPSIDALTIEVTD